MSEPKFTPGPWRVARAPWAAPGSNDAWVVEIPDARVADIAMEEPHDAHLVSAAPDLYAVVEAAEAAWGSLDTSSLRLWEANLLVIARVALEKARGEA